MELLEKIIIRTIKYRTRSFLSWACILSSYLPFVCFLAAATNDLRLWFDFKDHMMLSSVTISPLLALGGLFVQPKSAKYFALASLVSYTSYFSSLGFAILMMGWGIYFVVWMLCLAIIFHLFKKFRSN